MTCIKYRNKPDEETEEKIFCIGLLNGKLTE
jgi:hypothetical protein